MSTTLYGHLCISGRSSSVLFQIIYKLQPTNQLAKNEATNESAISTEDDNCIRRNLYCVNLHLGSVSLIELANNDDDENKHGRGRMDSANNAATASSSSRMFFVFVFKLIQTERDLFQFFFSIITLLLAGGGPSVSHSLCTSSLKSSWLTLFPSPSGLSYILKFCLECRRQDYLVCQKE